jgi:ribosomal protein S18 acetylase RimI-like enzyme
VSIEMEPVSPERAADLADLKAATFIETFAADNDPDQVRAHVAREFTPEAVRRSLEDERCSTWWLLDEATPVGFVKVNRGEAQTESHLREGLEVEQIYVLASRHGQRLGGRLMEQAIATARHERFPFVWLGVWEHNRRALAVYEHLGFSVIGDHTFLFGHEEQRDLLMRLDLLGHGTAAEPSGRAGR